jgi:hypothetical protein
MILSVDPGGTCGLAMWQDDGTFVNKLKLPLSGFVLWASDVDIELSTIIYEDFTLRASKAYAQRGSKLEASQGIGVVKALAARKNAKLVRQPSGILKITAMHAEVPIVTHFDDAVSAYLHGYYYFETKGLLKTKLQSR